MSLKAGRRGLKKRLVDAFGNLNGNAPSGEYYTKQQTDNKFETKTHVNNTFQKKTLEVPLEMLSGIKLTVEDAVQGLNEEKFTYADNSVLGAKNLLPNNATSQIINGLTFTVNVDGSIAVNGTATEDTRLILRPDTTEYNDKDIILSGCPLGGSQNTYSLVMRIGDSSGQYIYNVHNTGSDELITSEAGLTGTNLARVFISIRSGYTANNLIFYPMIRLASDPDDTYVPYAMTNRELTEELIVQESAVTNIIAGASVSDDLGNHLMKYGKVVCLTLSLNNVTTSQSWSDSVFNIPEGYRPIHGQQIRPVIPSDIRLQFNTSGSVLADSILSNSGLKISTTWITE